MRQYVLSAMKHEMFLGNLNHYELLSYFTDVQGIGDVLASGKLQQGRKLIADSGMDAGRFCLIGDTLHDYEVAMDLGCQCILLAQGHQSEERLHTSGQKVFRNLNALRLFLMNPA
jgi:phosphoglycolate phosphatase